MFELFGYLWELESEDGEDDQSIIKKRINSAFMYLVERLTIERF